MVTWQLLGAALAWIGPSLIVLSDGRRGLALGLAVTGIGMALTAYAAGHTPDAVLLAAGGVVAAGFRLRDGDRGWSLIPSGSTPRLVLCLVVLIAVLLIATSVKGMPVALVATLFASLLTACRVLSADRRSVALAATSGLALALAGMGTPVVAAAAAAIAVAVATFSAVTASPTEASQASE